MKEPILETIRSESKLKDFIYVFDNVINEKICDSIIEEYENKEEWRDGLIGNAMVNKEARNCERIGISTSEVINKNYNSRKLIDDQIFNSVSYIINEVRNKNKNLNISEDTGYYLLKYDTGGFIKEHVDSSSSVKNDRYMSCSICLNDDYKGGDFCFFEGELKYKLKKGSAIIFPSFFLFPHEILEITEGKRYSIITWIR